MFFLNRLLSFHFGLRNTDGTNIFKVYHCSNNLLSDRLIIFSYHGVHQGVRRFGGN